MSHGETFFDRLHARMPDILAWGFVGATLVLSGWGRIADGVNVMSLFFAAVFVLFQLGTNMMAIWARTLTWKAWPSVIGCIVAMIVFGLFSHESLRHAWGEAAERGYVDPASPLSVALLLALPFAEPFVFWIRQLLWERWRAAHAAEQREEEARLEAARQRDRDAAISNAANVTTLPKKRLTGAAAAASMLVLGGPHGASEAAPVTQADAPQTTHHEAPHFIPADAPQEAPQKQPKGAPKTRVTKQDKMRQEAHRLLLQGGASNRQIAAATGLSPSTVDRMAKVMTPLEEKVA